MKEEVLKHYQELRSLNSSVDAVHPKVGIEDSKTHVLFLNCLINQLGIYRTYLPYLILNKMESHSAIIANLQKYDFTKKFQDYTQVLNEELLAWADILVVPPLFFDCSEMLKVIHTINPKVKLYMDIPMNYFSPNLKTPNKVTPEELGLLLGNMNKMDNVLFASSKLKQHFEQQTKRYLGKINFGLAVIPTFFSTELVSQVDQKHKQNEKIRIGLLGTELNESFAKEISTLALAFQEDIQFYIYGEYNFNIAFLKDVGIEQYKSVHILDYFNMIGELKLDLFLLANNEADDFNIKSELLFGELALLGVPLLCNALHACGRYIKNGENGFVLQAKQTYRDALQGLIARKDSLASIGKNAQLMCKQHLCWNTKRASQLQGVFALGRS